MPFNNSLFFGHIWKSQAHRNKFYRPTKMNEKNTSQSTVKEHVKALQELRITCNHRNSDGTKCKLLSVIGTDKCALHGEAIGYSNVFKCAELSMVYKRFHVERDNLDLRGELALQRTALYSVIQKIEASSIKDLKATSIGLIMELTSIITSTVEKITKIESNMRNSVNVEDIKTVCDSIIAIMFEAEIDQAKIELVARKLNDLPLANVA